MAKEDRHGCSDNRVRWSDFSGFPSVRVDARHDHPVRRKGKAMKWVLVALFAILTAEVLWLTWPAQNKSLLTRPEFDTEPIDAR